MVDIEKALSISDYQCKERTKELRWLAEQASQRRVIVEVGSYKGCTARAMADNTTGVVFAVDTFLGSDETDMRRELSQHSQDWLFETFKKNTADVPNLKPVVMSSVDAAQFLRNQRFDMIFLDAAHDCDSIKADILAWRPLLAPGGLLCGHDRQWEGVEKAVNELIVRPEVGAGAIWYEANETSIYSSGESYSDS